MASVETSADIKQILRRHWLEEVYIKILEDIYKESIATITLHNVSDKIPIKKRVVIGNGEFRKKACCNPRGNTCYGKH